MSHSHAKHDPVAVRFINEGVSQQSHHMRQSAYVSEPQTTACGRKSYTFKSTT